MRYLLLSLITSFIFSSCATVFRKAKINKNINITTQPPNADVYVNGKHVGKTPMTYFLKKRKSKSIKITKEGYKDAYSSIDTKINPLWTSISVLTGAFPGFLIPTAIDYSTGALMNVTTDSIFYKLHAIPNSNLAVEPAVANENQPSTKISSPALTDQTITTDIPDIYNPKLQIRTPRYEFLLGYKTPVTITVKDGVKFKSNIKEFGDNTITLAKKNTIIYLEDITEIRVYNQRRWFPILTGLSIVGPIWWHINSKKVKKNSSSCKKEIKSIKIINLQKLEKLNYGKLGKCSK
jgi:hypothetical protein